MSGETEQQVSGWSVDTLRSHILALLDERDKRHALQFDEKDKRDEQRYIGSQEAITAALVAQEKAVSAALNAADRAVAKAEIAAEKRFEGTNEFRGQLADQAATLMPRAEAESRIGSISERLDAAVTTHQRELSTLRDDMQKSISGLALVQAGAAGKGSGYGAAWVIALGAIGAVSTIIGIVVVIITLSK